MVTGKNVCPICKKLYSPKNESRFKIFSGKYSDISKYPINDYVCMGCARKMVKQDDYGYAIKNKNGLVYYFDDDGNFERTKIGDD